MFHILVYFLENEHQTQYGFSNINANHKLQYYLRKIACHSVISSFKYGSYMTFCQ